MKAIIAGGRNFIGTQQHFEWLSKLCSSLNVDEIVSGGCTGADRFGEYFAACNDIRATVFMAQWSNFGRSAGPIRNLQMAQYADICILFPGGAGTQSMISCALQCGLHVEIWVEIDKSE